MLLISTFFKLTLAGLWEDKGHIDRAYLLVEGKSWNENLIIWQNTEECHHCTWIRSRDFNGQIIPKILPNTTSAVFVDTRWPQRFKLTYENDNDTRWQSTGQLTTEFVKFDSKSNYTLNNSTIIKLSGTKPDYMPIWGTFLLLITTQVCSTAIQILRNREQTTTTKRLKSLDTFRG